MKKEAIYLAARFGRQEEMRSIAAALSAVGHDITSRWITSPIEETTELPADTRRRCAEVDLEDIRRSSCVVSFTEIPRGPHSRGGRHVEFGYAVALKKRVIIVGHLENVFHCLNEVEFVGSREELLAKLGGKVDCEKTRYAVVPGWERYIASSGGNIFSCHRRHGLTPVIFDGRSWWPIKLSTRSQRLYFYPTPTTPKKVAIGVHVAVLTAFSGPPPLPGLECRHLNGISTDNRLVNLAWGTPEENQIDRIRHGTSNRGERQGSSRLTRDSVREIRLLAATGSSVKGLAKRFDVSRSCISSIATRRSWSWLD